MRPFQTRKLVAALTAAGLLLTSSHVLASAFQLWEQDVTNIANYHAGYAAAAFNASTAFYNPAALSRFKEQQVVLAGMAVFTNIKYQGDIAVNTVLANAPRSVTAQGGNTSVIPALHYVAPLSEQFAFGLSVDVPFGLKTTYGEQTILRYASTTTAVEVIDVSPVISMRINDKFSIGAGPDVQIMHGEFDQVGAYGPTSDGDSNGINRADDTGYGMHAGILYEFNPDTRIGLSYHSQVVHHLTGTSTLSNGIVNAFPVEGGIRSERAKVNLTLPGYTALSAYHKANQNYAVMGSIIYTQWNTVQNLVLQNVAGVEDTEATTSMLVIVPQHYHNTINLSVGADYFATDSITLRGALGFDQTPSRNAYRNVQLPDNNRYVVALGAHFQSTETLSFDLGWSHFFVNKTHISPPPQVLGDEVVTTNGSAKAGADVFGAQVVWDMI